MLTNGFINKKYNKMYFAQLFSWTIALVGELADSILGGIFISEDAVSATGLVQPLFSLVMFLAYILAIGCSTKFSNYIGAFDKEKAYKSAGIGLMLAVISGAAVAVMMYFGEDLYFRFYAAGAAVEALAREYYEYTILLAFAFPIYYTLYYLVVADGDETWMLYSDIAVAFLNAVFSLVLVQVWGVKGLALGSVLALVIGAGFLLPHYLSKRNAVHFSFKLEPKLIKEIFVSGSSMSLTTLYIGVVDIVMNKFIIDNFGDEYLAAYAVVNLILNLAQISMCATDAASPFIAVSYGEKNNIGLRDMLARCTKRTFLTTVGMTVVFLAIAPNIPDVYGITTPEISEVSIYLTRVLALSFVVTGVVYEWTSYLPMVGQPFLGNLVGFVYMLAAPLTIPVAFAWGWGFKGMIWGFFLTPFAAFAVAAMFIFAKFGKGGFPYAIVPNDNVVFMHEFAVNESENSLLRSTLREEMASAGLPSSLINKVELVLEETLMIIEEKNKGMKKQHLGDCTVIIDKNTVQLITRDNGMLFDITQEVELNSSIRHYVAARFINTSESTYLTTISFNRNSYVWNR